MLRGTQTVRTTNREPRLTATQPSTTWHSCQGVNRNRKDHAMGKGNDYANSRGTWLILYVPAVPISVQARAIAMPAAMATAASSTATACGDSHPPASQMT